MVLTDLQTPCRLLVLIAALLMSAGLQAQVPEHFLRLASDGQGQPRALEVAMVQYRDAAGRTLDLLSAVHVADRQYFAMLDARFERYDVVLYELVGDPDGTGDRASSPGLGLIGLLQGGMKNAMGLAFQLDEIDYRRRNFVHADMTGEELASSMAERGESWLGTFTRLWAASALTREKASGSAESALLIALFAPDRQAAIKRVMAESMVEQQHLFELLASNKGSALITERNRRALQMLERELAGGAQTLAIFYGAGHMPDFHRRVTGEYGFEPVRVEWVEAWNLVDPQADDGD